jgi:hypothetical protein
MIDTKYLGWSYPSENDDPYFDIIQGFFDQQDDTVFGLMNTAANIIIPPPTVTWASGTHTLTWDDDFEIPIMSAGFSLKVQYGPDGVTRSATFAEGQRMIVVVPRISSGEVTANFSVVGGGLTAESGLFTVGFCRNSKFYANFPQVYT